jgi:hypothetical protein
MLNKSITFKLNQINFLDKGIRCKIAMAVNELPYGFNTKKVKYFEDNLIEFYGKIFNQKENRLIDDKITLICEGDLIIRKQNK